MKNKKREKNEGNYENEKWRGWKIEGKKKTKKVRKRERKKIKNERNMKRMKYRSKENEKDQKYKWRMQEKCPKWKKINNQRGWKIESREKQRKKIRKN